MDQRLQDVLDSLLLNIAVLNEEIARLVRSEQFTASVCSMQRIEQIRGQCVSSLQNISDVERRLHKCCKLQLPAQANADILRLD